MPRSPEDNDRIRDARRDDILRAAANVFARAGLAAAKVSDIAREAGLSHGLVYHYFESKEAMFAALLDAKVKVWRESWQSAEAAGSTPLERIRCGVAAHLERLRSEPSLGRVMSHALLDESTPIEIRELVLRFAREGWSDAVRNIRACQEAGECASDVPPEQLATAFLAMIRGLALTHALHDELHGSMPSADVVLRLLAPLPPIEPSKKPDARTARSAETRRGRVEAPRTKKRAPARPRSSKERT